MYDRVRVGSLGVVVLFSLLVCAAALAEDGEKEGIHKETADDVPSPTGSGIDTCDLTGGSLADEPRCATVPITVVVTGTRTSKELKKTPHSIAIVPRQQIERASAESVAEALRDVPGVEVSDSGQAGQKRISIRTEDPRRVAILIDGQEFSDPRDVGTPVLVEPEMIERIEVLRGPASVLYGSKAIGGVVNIITKKGGIRPLQGTISSAFDSSANGWQGYGALYGGYEGFQYRLSGALRDYNNRQTPEGELDNTDFSNDSWGFYIGKKFEEHDIALSGDEFNSESGVYVDPRVATTPPLTRYAIDVPQRDRRKWGVFYNWTPTDSAVSKLHFDGYYQISERDFNTDSDTVVASPAGIDASPILTNTKIFTGSETDTVGGTLQLDLNAGEAHLFTVGGQFSLDDLDQSRTREVSSNGSVRPTEIVYDEASQNTFALFAQDDWSITESWNLIAGLRQYWIESELDETTRFGLEPDSQSDQALIGSLALNYAITEELNTWAKVGQGYVYPSLTETQTGAFAGPSFVTPNRELDPETSVSFDTGLRYTDDAVTVDSSLFMSVAEDYIDHVLCSTGPYQCVEPTSTRDRIYVNLNEARAFGGELSLSYRIADFTPYGAATWARRRYETATYTTYDTGYPTLSGRIGLKFERAVTDTIYLWADAYLRLADGSDERASATEVIHHGGWGTSNLSVGADFGKDRLYRLVADLTNIGNKTYTPAQENLLAPETAIFVKLIASF